MFSWSLNCASIGVLWGEFLDRMTSAQYPAANSSLQESLYIHNVIHGPYNSIHDFLVNPQALGSVAAL